MYGLYSRMRSPTLSEATAPSSVRRRVVPDRVTTRDGGHSRSGNTVSVITGPVAAAAIALQYDKRCNSMNKQRSLLCDFTESSKEERASEGNAQKNSKIFQKLILGCSEMSIAKETPFCFVLLDNSQCHPWLCMCDPVASEYLFRNMNNAFYPQKACSHLPKTRNESSHCRNEFCATERDQTFVLFLAEHVDHDDERGGEGDADDDDEGEEDNELRTAGDGQRLHGARRLARVRRPRPRGRALPPADAVPLPAC